MSTIGAISATLGLDSSNFVRGVQQAQTQLTQLVAVASASNSALTTALVPLALPAIAGGVAAGAIHDAQAWADAVYQVQLAMGGTAEQASLLAGEADRMHVPIQALATGLGILDKNLNSSSGSTKQFKNALAEIGLTVEGLRASSDKLGAIAAGMKTLSDETERLAVAKELMGRGGAALLPVLGLDPSQVAAIRDQLAQAGLIESESQITAARQSEQAWQRMLESVRGIGLQIGQALLPAFTSVANEISDKLPGAFSDAKRQVSELVTLANQLKAAFSGIQLPNLNLSKGGFGIPADAKAAFDSIREGAITVSIAFALLQEGLTNADVAISHFATGTLRQLEQTFIRLNPLVLMFGASLTALDDLAHRAGDALGIQAGATTANTTATTAGASALDTFVAKMVAEYTTMHDAIAAKMEDASASGAAASGIAAFGGASAGAVAGIASATGAVNELSSALYGLNSAQINVAAPQIEMGLFQDQLQAQVNDYRAATQAEAQYAQQWATYQDQLAQQGASEARRLANERIQEQNRIGQAAVQAANKAGEALKSAYDKVASEIDGLINKARAGIADVGMQKKVDEILGYQDKINETERRALAVVNEGFKAFSDAPLFDASKLVIPSDVHAKGKKAIERFVNEAQQEFEKLNPGHARWADQLLREGVIPQAVFDQGEKAIQRYLAQATSDFDKYGIGAEKFINKATIVDEVKKIAQGRAELLRVRNEILNDPALKGLNLEDIDAALGKAGLKGKTLADALPFADFTPATFQPAKIEAAATAAIRPPVHKAIAASFQGVPWAENFFESLGKAVGAIATRITDPTQRFFAQSIAAALEDPATSLVLKDQYSKLIEKSLPEVYQAVAAKTFQLQVPSIKAPMVSQDLLTSLAGQGTIPPLTLPAPVLAPTALTAVHDSALRVSTEFTNTVTTEIAKPDVTTQFGPNLHDSVLRVYTSIDHAGDFNQGVTDSFKSAAATVQATFEAGVRDPILRAMSNMASAAARGFVDSLKTLITDEINTAIAGAARIPP